MRFEKLTIAVLALLALFSLLGLFMETNKLIGIETPAFGGTFREGITGSPRFINPLLAQTDADRDLTSLVYTGLFRYDGDSNVVSSLAEKYDVSPDGLTYTVYLKENIFWQNGEKVTAEDVVFTVELAKNPLIQSPKRASWEGIEIEQVNEKEVRFQLRKAYAPFLENLTLGILPKHLWESVPPSQISFAELNLRPVGNGPYKLISLKKDFQGTVSSAKLRANKYYVWGKPHIRTIIINFYKDEERALRDLQNNAIDSLGAISPKNTVALGSAKINQIALKRIIAVFLNQSVKKEFASRDIRRALNLAVDKKTLLEKALVGYGEIIDGPLPRAAESVEYNAELARNLLAKQKKDIGFMLSTVKTPELVGTAELIKDMWNAAGFKVEIKSFPISELEAGLIGPRKYDAFLYGEELVGRVPDPFAFWHSSQRIHPGYNIALYANSKVDKLLEEVRGSLSEKDRERLYSEIQTEIKKDLPAIFLFSPHYLYILPKNLGGTDIKSINTGSDRFTNIHNWYLKKNYVWKIFTN